MTLAYGECGSVHVHAFTPLAAFGIQSKSSLDSVHHQIYRQ